ncbi:hypothetical protein L7F22_050153 [Adiantum nelumboides]|nr:hypothetical protein [Adiantum nelumboides]
MKSFSLLSTATLALAIVPSAFSLPQASPAVAPSSASSSSASSAASTATGTTSANSTISGSLNSTNASVPSAGPLGLDNVRCSPITLTTPVNSSNVNFTNVDDNYNNDTYIIQQVLEFTTDQTNWTANHMSNEKQPFNATYNISGHYCEPIQGLKDNSSLLFAVHGIGFDSRYWDFSYSKNYSLVRHAASHGYASFIFDRLGTGNSSAPSTGGFSAVQAPTDLAIVRNLLEQVRNSTVVGNKTHEKITYIGHSYGSVLGNAISATAPQLIDNLVLTGFSANSTYNANFAQAGAFQKFSEIQGLPNNTNKPGIYIGSNNVSSVQLFLDPPNYEQAAAQLAFQQSQPLTLGQFFSLSSISAPAKNYTGPVFVVDGERDFPFCGRQCNAPSGNYSDMAAASQQLFPVTKNFTSYLQPYTGHGISISPYSGEVYERVLAQIIATGN